MNACYNRRVHPPHMFGCLSDLSFSSGGHESSNALAVLLSRFVLSLASSSSSPPPLLLGARLLVLRLRSPLPSGWRAPRTRRPSPRRWQGCRPGRALERRQRAAVERSGEGGAAGVGDLGVAEVERLELRQPSRRRRRRTCRRRRRHEGGEALVAERVASRRATPARAAAARPARGPPAPRRRWRRCPDRGS